MYPVMSLSKTWKPRTYSSGGPGSLKPFGLLRILRNVSKSTMFLISKLNFTFQSSDIKFRKGAQAIGYLQSFFTLWPRSSTSAFVGFCPQARSRSPRDDVVTLPVPLLSNRANASL